MSLRPRAQGHRQLVAQGQDLRVLLPHLPPGQAQQRHGAGDDEEDQFQARKPKIIARTARRRPARWTRGAGTGRMSLPASLPSFVVSAICATQGAVLCSTSRAACRAAGPASRCEHLDRNERQPQPGAGLPSGGIMDMTIGLLRQSSIPPLALVHVPGVDQLDAHAGEIAGVPGGNGHAAGRGNCGDHGIDRLADLAADPLPGGHDGRQGASGLLVVAVAALPGPGDQALDVRGEEVLASAVGQQRQAG